MGDEVLTEVFLNEAGEILEKSETDLVALEENPSQEVINRLFRYFHTLKGSSGIAGFLDVSEFTHRIENLLDSVRDGSIAVDTELIDILLQSLDWLRVVIFGGNEEYDISSNRDSLLGRVAAFGTRATAVTKQAAIPAAGANDGTKSNYFRVKISFRPDIFEFGIDPLVIIDDLCSLGTVEEMRTSREKVPSLKIIDPEKCYLSWMIILQTTRSIDEINNVFLFVRDDNQIQVDDVSAGYNEEPGMLVENQRIGDILVLKGVITQKELDDVLAVQDHQNRKLGDILVERGLASEKDLQKALGLQNEIRKKIENSTVRVDTVKLDNLMNLLGEIVIGQSAISRISDELDDEKGYVLKNALYGLDRITREFQEQIMSIRMIPVGPTFTQFKRFVRDSAHQLGKSIRLEVKGNETELDKTVIEKISDPLKHMIRNSIDHGIESPEERLKKDKPEEGVILLNAYHQEGNVYIEISDDGQGLDLQKIRNKAREKGMLGKDEEVSEEKLLNFIFMPGFSTASQVGELSGRGVGMDVVRNDIGALRGSVEIKTGKDEGTLFRIKLPLTLAIIEGMLCRVGRNVYIIPLLSIVESIQPKQEEVQTVKGQGEVVLVRGEYVSLVRLYSYFGVEGQYADPWEALVIIVESGGEKLALMIDDLIGQQQIVIKSLDRYITSSRAISGAAILGDGNVALILDIHGLLSSINAR